HPIWANMQNKNTAMELVKRFQQLFTDLDHRQIAERLVKLVVVKPVVSRVVLIVKRDERLYVEAIACHRVPSPLVSATATVLSRINYLPHQHIHTVFETALPIALDTLEIAEIGRASCRERVPNRRPDMG